MTVLAPSKKFLYRKLQVFLKKFKGKIGIDLASENFKNSNFFKTETYIGVDIKKSLIKQGLKKKNHINKIGIVADLTQENKIGINFADVAVSTNTLYQIKKEGKRLDAIKNFIEFVKPGGGLFLQMEKEHISRKIIYQIKENFKYFKIIYYHNYITDFYLNLFYGQITKNKKAILLDKIKLGYFFLILEFILNYFPFLNIKAIIICYNKKKINKKSYLNKEILIND